jgi:hypothetical protein
VVLTWKNVVISLSFQVNASKRTKISLFHIVPHLLFHGYLSNSEFIRFDRPISLIVVHCRTLPPNSVFVSQFKFSPSTIANWCPVHYMCFHLYSRSLADVRTIVIFYFLSSAEHFLHSWSCSSRSWFFNISLPSYFCPFPFLRFCMFAGGGPKAHGKF